MVQVHSSHNIQPAFFEMLLVQKVIFPARLTPITTDMLYSILRNGRSFWEMPGRDIDFPPGWGMRSLQQLSANQYLLKSPGAPYMCRDILNQHQSFPDAYLALAHILIAVDTAILQPPEDDVDFVVRALHRNVCHEFVLNFDNGKWALVQQPASHQHPAGTFFLFAA